MKDLPIQIMFSRKQWKRLPSMTVPASMLIGCDERARLNHAGQDVDRLASRGGCSPCEVLAILDNRKWHMMDEDAAYYEIERRIKAHNENNC